MVKLNITNGYITLQSKVNGSDVRFLLDTGADATVVTPELAKKLDLPITGKHEGGVAGGKKIVVDLTKIDKIKVGEVVDSIKLAVIVDINKDPGPYGKIDGILGSDFIRNHPISIDYKSEALIFETDESLAERRQNGYTFDLHLIENTAPYVSLTINDTLKVENKYKVDTGAGKTYLRLQDIQKLGISLNSLEESKGSSLAGSYKKYNGTIKSISLGNSITKKNVKIGAYETPIGFLGSDFLSNYVVTLNYPKKEIIFQ